MDDIRIFSIPIPGIYVYIHKEHFRKKFETILAYWFGKQCLCESDWNQVLEDLMKCFDEEQK